MDRLPQSQFFHGHCLSRKFFRLRPGQGELCLQIPAIFWHNVQMYHLTVYHLDFGKLYTTFKKSAQYSIKIFTSALSFKRIFLLFVFLQGICKKFASLSDSLLNKGFKLLLFLSTFYTELTTAASTTSLMWIETN